MFGAAAFFTLFASIDSATHKEILEQVKIVCDTDSIRAHATTALHT